MNNRQRSQAILNYETYDRLPLVHFGFWQETLEKWEAQGHLPPRIACSWQDGNRTDATVSGMLGFDYNWSSCFSPATRLFPPIEKRVLKTMPDGSREVLNAHGAIVIEKPGITCIPAEVDHMLKGRKEWEEFFLPRLQFSEERIVSARVDGGEHPIPFNDGGLEHLQRGQWDNPYGLYCGSLYGVVRNWLGLEGSVFLQVDDPALFDEIVSTVGELCYQIVESVLKRGARFDFGHLWEDICFRSGPLVNPAVFAEKVGPHYRRITDLLSRYQIDVVSLDCDGKIDALIPVWMDNGVNTMFPIEVGTWHASIEPWRAKYGRQLRGVGGMDKKVFAYDFAAIDAEVERLKPLVALGGYIPCPDHRIPADAKWENVQYYCSAMRRAFG